jgi:TPR repeat protein
MYEYGLGGLKTNPEKALLLYEKAASQGYAPAVQHMSLLETMENSPTSFSSLNLEADTTTAKEGGVYQQRSLSGGRSNNSRKSSSSSSSGGVNHHRRSVSLDAKRKTNRSESEVASAQVDDTTGERKGIDI